MQFTPVPGKRIRFHRQRFEAVVQRRVVALRGITRVLRDTFFPLYAPGAACLGPRDPPVAADPALPAQPRGAALGRLVDAELQEWVELVWRHGLTWSEALDGGAPERLPEPERVRFLHLRWHGHPYTLRLLTALRARGYALVAAQVPVGSVSLRLGTAVDLVVVPRAQLRRHGRGWRLAAGARLVLLEVKTGFGRDYYRHTRHAPAAPLQSWHDAPYHQHQLQLWLTRTLFERTYLDARQGHQLCSGDACGLADEAFVVRVHGTAVEWWPLEPWSSERQWALWARLRQ